MNESGLDFNIPIQDNSSNKNAVKPPQDQPKNDNNQQNQTEQQNSPKDEQINITNFYKKSSNPKICILTVLFKVLAIGSFILLNLFTRNESLVIIVVILLGAIDFWFTKNISGRILVGLRWWNHIKKETGQEVWLFESKNESNKTKSDQTTFWTSLYISTAFWVLLVLWELIKFDFIWCAVCVILAIFSVTNCYGFFKCSKIQQNNAKNLTFDIAKNIGKKGMGIVN